MNGYKPLVSKDFTELKILQLSTFSRFLIAFSIVKVACSMDSYLCGLNASRIMDTRRIQYSYSTSASHDRELIMGSAVAIIE